MARRISVIMSQGQSANPIKRKLEEEIVAELLGARGIDVTVVPHLYDLDPKGTGMLCLRSMAGPMIVLSWLYPRAAHWVLDRDGILGDVGLTQLPSDVQEDDDEEEQESDEQKEGESEVSRVIDEREKPNRSIYCLDLRANRDAQVFIAEIHRIAEEINTAAVPLLSWINGSPKEEQLNRYLGSESDNGASDNGTSGDTISGNGATNGQAISGPIKLTDLSPAENNGVADSGPHVLDEQPARRWYPVIDFSRCTNCMECIDFCLFGVYGVDAAETILVELPDNCRKGCPACSRVCPENAIIFPQHKSPAIAGDPEMNTGGMKIDLSLLFGGGDGKSAVGTAAAERDEQLRLAGREEVGMTEGISPRAMESGQERAKDTPSPAAGDLDALVDALDDFDL